jgi:invasion protein IalB
MTVLRGFPVSLSLCGALALAGLTGGAAVAQSPTAGAQLLGQFGDWGAYSASPGGKKICFALAKPTSSETNPPGRPRDPAWLFVSTRPAEKVKEEVSVIIGYPFKANSDAVVEVGSTNFAMYTQNDGAWVKNAAEEARLIEAMRRGADVTVKGESGRGTKTTDRFSLKGVAQALDRAAQECR